MMSVLFSSVNKGNKQKLTLILLLEENYPKYKIHHHDSNNNCKKITGSVPMASNSQDER
jgi:hypothetical protein